ncbi:MAG: HAMP domain-containing sensor histidine kinase [Pseudomonadota bacterium]
MTSKNFDHLNDIGLPTYCIAPSDLGDLVFCACNELWAELIGHGPETLLNQTPAAVLHGDAGIPWEQLHKRIYRSAKEENVELPLPDGSAVNVYIVPQLDAGGSSYALTAVVHPVIKTDQSAPSDSTQAQLTHEIEKFISMAAHDLRTPMRNVQNLADMLREDFVDMGDGKLELIDLLENVAIKATALISDVLSHAQAGDAEGAKEDFRFDTLCHDIHHVVDPPQKHKIEVLPLMIEAEKVAIQIIVRNLLDNAIKHGKRTSLYVYISVAEGTNGMLDFTVSDNGAGFSDPSLAFLSGGEFRIDSGYGMLGIRRMIGERGGTISAQNSDTDERGGIVNFSLPGRLIGQVEHSHVA